MKKAEPVRLYNFSDAQLIVTAKEKANFMNRDVTDFTPYGVMDTTITNMMAEADAFADYLTDWEAKGDQAEFTAIKNTKAEDLRVGLRELMARVEQKIVPGSAKHNKFRCQNLAKQNDADLLISAKLAVREAKENLAELADTGINQPLLDSTNNLIQAYENALLEQLKAIGSRDELQEERVNRGNALYNRLITYANIGKTIWETKNAAKYNDYVIYNTPSGQPEAGVPPQSPE